MTTAEGFAIRRNGSCLVGLEVDCGATRAPFRGCCPLSFACPSQYNIACCMPGTNCTQTLVEAPQPRCANATWDTFDNGGYFCCEHGLPGFNRSNTNGCAGPGSIFETGDIVLSTVRVGTVEAATLSSSSSSRASPISASATTASATASANATPSSSSVPSGSSSTPVGAIAGGVIGGVIAIALLAFLAWYFLKRRRNKAGTQVVHEAYAPVNGDRKLQSHANPYVHELGNTTGTRTESELPALQRPVELPAEQRSKH